MFCDALVPHSLTIVPKRTVVAKILEKPNGQLVLRISKNAKNMQFSESKSIFWKKFNFCIASSGMILGYIMTTFRPLESSYHQVDYCNCKYVHVYMCAIFETKINSMEFMLQNDSWVWDSLKKIMKKFSHSIFCRFESFSFWWFSDFRFQRRLLSGLRFGFGVCFRFLTKLPSLAPLLTVVSMILEIRIFMNQSTRVKSLRKRIRDYCISWRSFQHFPSFLSGPQTCGGPQVSKEHPYSD